MASPRARIALTASAAFHLGLAAALAVRTSAIERPLQLRAGDDARESTSWIMPQAAAEPMRLETSVVVTREQTRLADRRLIPAPVEWASRDLPPDLAPVELATALLQRLSPPEQAPPEQPATPAEQPAEPAPAAPRSTEARAAAAASSRRVGAEAAPAVQPRIVPPVFTTARPPVFPAEAQQRGWSGVVLLKITVDERGAVAAVSVARSSGHPALDAAAARAVRTWRGRPAMRNGQPYRSTWNQPVRFE